MSGHPQYYSEEAMPEELQAVFTHLNIVIAPTPPHQQGHYPQQQLQSSQQIQPILHPVNHLSSWVNSLREAPQIEQRDQHPWLQQLQQPQFHHHRFPAQQLIESSFVRDEVNSMQQSKAVDSLFGNSTEKAAQPQQDRHQYQQVQQSRDEDSFIDPSLKEKSAEADDGYQFSLPTSRNSNRSPNTKRMVEELVSKSSTHAGASGARGQSQNSQSQTAQQPPAHKLSSDPLSQQEAVQSFNQFQFSQQQGPQLPQQFQSTWDQRTQTRLQNQNLQPQRPEHIQTLQPTQQQQAQNLFLNPALTLGAHIPTYDHVPKNPTIPAPQELDFPLPQYSQLQPQERPSPTKFLSGGEKNDTTLNLDKATLQYACPYCKFTSVRYDRVLAHIKLEDHVKIQAKARIDPSKTGVWMCNCGSEFNSRHSRSSHLGQVWRRVDPNHENHFAVPNECS